MHYVPSSLVEVVDVFQAQSELLFPQYYPANNNGDNIILSCLTHFFRQTDAIALDNMHCSQRVRLRAEVERLCCSLQVWLLEKEGTPMSRLQEELVRNLLLKKLPATSSLATPELIAELSIYLGIKLERQNYILVSKLLEMPTHRHSRVFRAPKRIKYLPGDNAIAMELAPGRFGDEWLTSMGDGTRISRKIERIDEWLVGEGLHPDVCKRDKEPGFPVPQLAEDLLTYVYDVRATNRVAPEMYTEMYRCTTGEEVPTLVYHLWPESGAGFSGFLHTKLWLKFVGAAHTANLNLVAFNTDSCSTGISAARIWHTPSDEWVGLGVSYVGLDVSDYQYYDPYVRPRRPSCELPPGDGRAISGTEPPPPIGWLGDIAHLVRTFRRNLDNLGVSWIFQTTVNNKAEDDVFASFDHLRDLAQQGCLSRHFGLADVVTINRWRDQKSDAAYRLCSRKTIALLETYAPQDKATIIALHAMFLIAEVFKNPNFTCPLKIVEYLWEALAIFESQEVYVKDVAKINVDEHCPSYQFRETVRLMVHGATNYVLKFARHMIPAGRSWQDCRLSRCNSDPLEGLHSDGRCLHGNDCNFTAAEWCRLVSHLQMLNESRVPLQKAGLEVPAPKNSGKSMSGTITTLGSIEATPRNIEAYHDGKRYPLSYDGFVKAVAEARLIGRGRGLERLATTLPIMAQQMKEAGKWNVFPKLERPEGMKIVSGNLDVMENTPVPPRVISPDRLVVPDKVKKKLDELERKLAKERAASMDTEGGGDGAALAAERSAHLNTMKVNVLRKRQEVDEALAQGKKKSRIKSEQARMLTEGGGHVSKEFARGDKLLLDNGKIVNTDRVLAVEQKREIVSRDRGKRFWVGRLREFWTADSDHNVTLGTCLLVKWGTDDFFAAVRVVRIVVEKERRYSCKLPDPKKEKQLCKNTAFRVELLELVGEPTEHGSQYCRGSGCCLGSYITADLVICVVEMLRLDGLHPGSHEALLLAETIAEQSRKTGRHLLSKEEGEGLIDRDDDARQVAQEGFFADVACRLCCSKWYDASTGVIAKCTQCGKAYHQECANPKIKTDSLHEWVCAVCSGEDGEICAHCGEDCAG